MATDVTQDTAAHTAYRSAVEAAGLDAPWFHEGPLILPKKTKVQPRLWRWADIEPLLRRTPEFVAPGRGAERRILRLANPGVPERTVTHTLSGAVQFLMPGETAPAHRHTPNAIRFMLHGEGAYTTVAGDKMHMRRGDLVLTPAGTWHDHGNEGTGPVMWFDGLDSPVVRYLEGLKMEGHPTGKQTDDVRAGVSTSTFSAPGLRPGRVADRDSYHLLHFRWETTYPALQRLAEHWSDPYDDVITEYVDPATGRSVFPTMGCYLQLIRAGVQTRAHLQTSSAVYYVVQGSGVTTIDGTPYAWREGDFFALPPSVRHAHANDGRDEAVLFSLQDVPLLQAAGFYREEQ
jgi:gentisate 1,2-dioxygenase